MSKRKSLWQIHLTDLLTKLEDHQADVELSLRKIESEACEESGYNSYEVVLSYIGTIDGLKRSYINGSSSERFNFHALNTCPKLKKVSGLIVTHKAYTSELEGLTRKIASVKETLQLLEDANV